MPRARQTLTVALGLLVALLVFAGGWIVGRLGIGSVVSPASMTDAERDFTERMRDVSLIGSFTSATRQLTRFFGFIPTARRKNSLRWGILTATHSIDTIG